MFVSKSVEMTLPIFPKEGDFVTISNANLREFPSGCFLVTTDDSTIMGASHRISLDEYLSARPIHPRQFDLTLVFLVMSNNWAEHSDLSPCQLISKPPLRPQLVHLSFEFSTPLFFQLRRHARKKIDLSIKITTYFALSFFLAYPSY